MCIFFRICELHLYSVHVSQNMCTHLSQLLHKYPFTHSRKCWLHLNVYPKSTCTYACLKAVIKILISSFIISLKFRLEYFVWNKFLTGVTLQENFQLNFDVL